MTRTTIFIIIAVVVLIGLGYLLFFSGEQMQLESEEITLTGTLICLPHRDTSGPQTLECAFGLQTGEGVNYALDTDVFEGDAMTNFNTGSMAEISGVLIPRDDLDSDSRFLQYEIEGVVQASAVTPVGGADNTAGRHVISGGLLSFERPADWGLAISDEQVLMESVVPPCSSGFDYCLYYNATTTYADTNFESAGLRLESRPDLETEEACLNEPPVGYNDLNPEVSRKDTYATSVFTPLRDAATGHSAEGLLYRLAFDATCYEFETRIGVSQFENFEPGTVEEFTASDRSEVEGNLANLLRMVRFTDNSTEVIFP
jgi:hypothetical protein